MSTKQKCIENAERMAQQLRMTIRVWCRVINGRLKYAILTPEQEEKERQAAEQRKKEGKPIDTLEVGYVVAEFKP